MRKKKKGEGDTQFFSIISSVHGLKNGPFQPFLGTITNHSKLKYMEKSDSDTDQTTPTFDGTIGLTQQSWH